MKGTNRIHLNHATVMEAIQEYIDKHVVSKPVVSSINTTMTTTWGMAMDPHGELIVTVTSNEDFVNPKTP